MFSHALGSKFTEGILQLREHLFVNEATQKCGNRILMTFFLCVLKFSFFFFMEFELSFYNL